MVVALVIIHETAHILTAMVFGVRLGELKFGFMGINPSVTLPGWFTGTRQTVVHYAGGFTAGVVLMLFYLLCWIRKYWYNPNFFTWSLGLITLIMAAMQFATGYLEGRMLPTSSALCRSLPRQMLLLMAGRFPPFFFIRRCVRGVE